MKALLDKLTAATRSPVAYRAFTVAAAWAPILLVAVAFIASLVPALHHAAAGHLPDVGWIVTRKSHYDPTRDPRLRFAGDGSLALSLTVALVRHALAP